MKLRYNLIFGLGPVLLGMGGGGVRCRDALGRVRETADFMHRDSLPALYRAGQAKAAALQGYADSIRLVVEADPAALVRIQMKVEEVHRVNSENLAQYEKTIRFDGDRRLFSRLNETRTRWSELRQSAFALATRGKQGEARAALLGGGRRVLDAYLAAADAMVEYNRRNGEGCGVLMAAGLSSMTSVSRAEIWGALLLVMASFVFRMRQRRYVRATAGGGRPMGSAR